MEMSQVHNIAKRLYEAHGLKAEVEAARELQEAERAGNDEQKDLWRRVRSAVHDMKGARES